jgi:flagellar protein FliS
MTQNSTAYRAHQAYRDTAVAVPPLKAVVMLCDGAIMFLQKAAEAQDTRRFEEGHDHLMRATAILRGLSHHLDFARGGTVAERLYHTYNTVILACLRAYGQPGMRENLGRIRASLAELRDAWAVVDATVVKGTKGGPGARR